MTKLRENSASTDGTPVTVSYEAEFWKLKTVLRSRMGAVDYMHVALGQIFPNPCKS
jgi:hypothetical protein